MKYFAVIKKRIRADGFFGSIIFIASRLIAKVRSLIMSKILKAPNLNLGADCQIFGIKFIRFGRAVSAHRSLWLEAVCEYKGEIFYPEIIFGDRVSMSQNVHITCIRKISIGSDVLIGSNVYISDHNHGIYNGSDLEHSLPSQSPTERELYSSGSVIIEENVWIGDNVNIVGPCHIGRGAIVASNSVLRGNVIEDTIVAGIPARTIKRFNHISKKWEKYA